MSVNKKQLVGYLSLNPLQIIAKYGLKNLTGGIPTQKTVIDLYKYDKMPPVVITEIFKPGTLAINVRKMGMRELRYQLLRDKNYLIFNSYIVYMINKNYEVEVDKETNRRVEQHMKTGMVKANRNTIKDEVIDEIIIQQKTEQSPEQLGKLKDRIIDLFKLGMLSSSLSDIIDSDIELLQIPSEEEVEEAELAEILPVQIEIEKEKEVEDVSSVGSSVGSSNPVTKILKKSFSDDKLNRSQLMDLIISIKGGHLADYDDWSVSDLKQRLESLETEEKPITEVENLNFVYVQPSGKPIIIFKDEEKNPPELVPFNPESYTGMLTINNLSYPTIQHYIIAKLISNTGTKQNADSYGSVSFQKGVGILEAHRLIKIDYNNNTNQPIDFLTLHLSGEVYDKLNRDTDEMLLSIYTATALNKKFEDVGLQDLLILTGDNKINWNSPQNYYLGVGNKEYDGKNYVGTTMMDIRTKLKETRVDEEEVEVEIDDILKFINKDPFIMEWIKMRVQDMCGTVYKLQQLILKDDIENELMIQLIKYGLDTVYQPCSELIRLSQNVDIKVPDFFLNIVSKCKGMSSGITPVSIIEDKRSENERRIGNLTSEFYGNRIEHTVDEGKEFEKHLRTDWRKFWDDLNISDFSPEEKQIKLSDFKIRQKEEHNTFWGIDSGKKSNDDFSRLDNQISELKNEFSTYLRKAEKISKDIAQIYWNRIVVMLSALIQNVNPSTSSNVRDVLVKIEMFNSIKVNCVRIIANETDNCIVSALLNLLTGIVLFKKEFSGNLELDEDDVKLSGSIILNTKFQASHVNTEIPELDDEENESKQFDVSPSGSFPADELVHQPDDEPVDDYDENPYFEFGDRKSGIQFSEGDIAKIEQQVLLISPVNSNGIALDIMKTVQIIKNSNMSTKIKQNRINFFATIR